MDALPVPQQQLQQQLSRQPSISIIEEPVPRVRFRYVTEGEKAGNIYGVSSNNLHHTFPTVMLNNCEGYRVEVIMSCVTATPPVYYPHPHRLVGQDCDHGVCRIPIKRVEKRQNPVQFTRVGVQCCKQKEEDISKSLAERYSYASNPFNLTSPHVGGYDLAKICLCFQAIVFTDQCPYQLVPCVSRPIMDRRVAGDLMICRLSRSHGSVRGGDELFLLCSAVKKDVEVVFEVPDGSWSTKAEFSPSDIHRQIAIVLRTPPFYNENILEPVLVNIYLQSPTLNERSNVKPFQYIPENSDPYHIEAKRKRKADGLRDFIKDVKIPPVCMPSAYGHPSFTSAPVPNLLHTNTAGVGLSFPLPPPPSFLAPPSSLDPALPTFLSPNPVLPVNSAAGPRTEWRPQYPPSMPNQFRSPQQVAVPPQIHPPWPVAVPSRAGPPSAVNNSQMTSNSPVEVRSTRVDVLSVPNTSSVVGASATESPSIDDILSWLTDVTDNPSSGAASNQNYLDDLNGFFNDILAETAAIADITAADATVATSSAAVNSQTVPMVPEPQNPPTSANNIDDLLSQLKQLNEFAKPV